MSPKRVLRRSFWVTWGSVVGYLLGLAAVAVLWLGQSDTNTRLEHEARLGVQTHVVLCGIKAGVVRGIRVSESQLHGQRGALRRLSVARLKSQRETLAAIRGLRCPSD